MGKDFILHYLSRKSRCSIWSRSVAPVESHDSREGIRVARVALTGVFSTGAAAWQAAILLLRTDFQKFIMSRYRFGVEPLHQLQPAVGMFHYGRAAFDKISGIDI